MEVAFFEWNFRAQIKLKGSGLQVQARLGATIKSWNWTQSTSGSVILSKVVFFAQLWQSRLHKTVVPQSGFLTSSQPSCQIAKLNEAKVDNLVTRLVFDKPDIYRNWRINTSKGYGVG